MTKKRLTYHSFGTADKPPDGLRVLVVENAGTPSRSAKEIAERYSEKGVRVIYWNNSGREGIKDFVDMLEAVTKSEGQTIKALGLLGHQNIPERLGRLRIGNTCMESTPEMSNHLRYRDEFLRLRKILAKDAQFQIWGCNVAAAPPLRSWPEQNKAAQQMLRDIAIWTNATVFASVDYTVFGTGDNYRLDVPLAAFIADSKLEFSTSAASPIPLFGDAHAPIPALPPTVVLSDSFSTVHLFGAVLSS
jgi:hypothetical protein